MFINKFRHGFSLIELIIYILIVSIALYALLSVLNVTTQNSVDPLINKQALAIAESLLEEIELQNFSNPTGGFTGAATQANRTRFDDIMDYHGFSTIGIYPADGSAVLVPGLSNYSVSVSVVKTTAVWATVAAGDAAQITVTVTDSRGQTLQAVGYRMNY